MKHNPSVILNNKPSDEVIVNLETMRNNIRKWFWLFFISLAALIGTTVYAVNRLFPENVPFVWELFGRRVSANSYLLITLIAVLVVFIFSCCKFFPMMIKLNELSNIVAEYNEQLKFKEYVENPKVEFVSMRYNDNFDRLEMEFIENYQRITMLVPDKKMRVNKYKHTYTGHPLIDFRDHSMSVD